MGEAFLRFDNARGDEEPLQQPEPLRPRGYQEYPKWVTPPGGDPIIVQSAEEEARVTGRPVPEPMPAPVPAPVPSLPVRVSTDTPPEPEVAGPAKAGIAGRLIRAARGILDWSQADLAQRAGLSLPTVRNLEKAADDEMGGAAKSIAAVEQALSDAGVNWYDAKGQLGVWMPKREGQDNDT